MDRRGLRCDAIEESDNAYSFAARSDAGTCLVMVGWVGDDDERQWLVFTEQGKEGLLRRSTVDPSAAMAALHATLTEDLGVEPQWFTRRSGTTRDSEGVHRLLFG